MPFTKENAKEYAKKSQEAWDRNGRKPRGFAADPKLAREAASKSLEKVRRNSSKRTKLSD